MGRRIEKDAEGEITKKEHILKLDPINKEILKKIKNLKNKIENIYGNSIEQGDSKDTISRKLGPYSRDIKKLQNQIERAESPIDESVSATLDETERLLEAYLKK